ncbi:MULTISPECIES: hypothetical protein [unclassified Anaerobiospirillum]|uniref:hypothetical protein n=1 Tax=unclassified Anaerobiospirillum TaxID=2647410 RepID=UPI001FF63191|nr:MULTISPECIES: hypothetical protein [unclassified Anaerobiospirillum]MCK0533768.1 hypothetical protein [Anaerobiospirillum sp. NML120511]MCK0539041.1 hypothetical protein [Anaerobiospirillum sp. NML02-A-032]
MDVKPVVWREILGARIDFQIDKKGVAVFQIRSKTADVIRKSADAGDKIGEVTGGDYIVIGDKSAIGTLVVRSVCSNVISYRSGFLDVDALYLVICAGDFAYISV